MTCYRSRSMVELTGSMKVKPKTVVTLRQSDPVRSRSHLSTGDSLDAISELSFHTAITDDGDHRLSMDTSSVPPSFTNSHLETNLGKSVSSSSIFKSTNFHSNRSGHSRTQSSDAEPEEATESVHLLPKKGVAVISLPSRGSKCELKSYCEGIDPSTVTVVVDGRRLTSPNGRITSSVSSGSCRSNLSSSKLKNKEDGSNEEPSSSEKFEGNETANATASSTSPLLCQPEAAAPEPEALPVQPPPYVPPPLTPTPRIVSPSAAIPMHAVGSGCHTCRNCWDHEGDMISPCTCAGTNGYVHRECLEAWLRQSGLRSCNVCGSDFPVVCRMKPLREWKLFPSCDHKVVLFILLTLTTLFLIGWLLYGILSTLIKNDGAQGLDVTHYTISFVWLGVIIITWIPLFIGTRKHLIRTYHSWLHRNQHIYVNA